MSSTMVEAYSVAPRAGEVQAKAGKSLSASEPVSSFARVSIRPSDAGGRANTAHGISGEAAEALKQFVRRNRSLSANKSSTYKSEGGLSSLASVGAGAVEPAFEERLKKFDIFDEVDRDRLQEFEQVLSKLKSKST